MRVRRYFSSHDDPTKKSPAVVCMMLELYWRLVYFVGNVPAKIDLSIPGNNKLNMPAAALEAQSCI